MTEIERLWQDVFNGTTGYDKIRKSTALLSLSAKVKDRRDVGNKAEHSKAMDPIPRLCDIHQDVHRD